MTANRKAELFLAWISAPFFIRNLTTLILPLKQKRNYCTRKEALTLTL